MSSSSSSSDDTEITWDADYDGKESSSYPDLTSTSLPYWRNVTGNDLVHILRTKNYDKEAIDRFMQYFIKHIPRAWGFVSSKNSTGPDETAPSLNLDNSPIEIGLTFTAAHPNPADRPPVRLIAEVDHLTARRCLSEYSLRNVFGPIKYEMDWADSLYRSIMKHTSSTYFGDVRLGFDIRPAVRRPSHSIIMFRGPGPLPADARVYFVATRKAQHLGITRWALIRQSILNLPGINEDGFWVRRILSGVRMVDDFLAEYPPEFGNLISIVDIGPEDMKYASIGLSFTIPAGATSPDFEEVWKWVTLGGRITKLRRGNDKFLTHIFYDQIHGLDASQIAVESDRDLTPYIDRAGRAKAGTLPLPQVAPCSVYFSLAAQTEEPTATLVADVLYGSRTDYEVAKSFGSFLEVQQLPLSFGSYPSLVQTLFPALPLGQDPELKLHTSVSFCRQEGADPGRDDWTLRTCYNPLYYQCARP